MKTLKDIRLKAREYLQLTGYFFVDIWGWVRSLWICTFRSIVKPAIFYGYGSYEWASKYAEKRFTKWRPEWDQAGRQQGTFPLGEIKLLVCSKMELEIFKKKGLVSKNLKPRKAIRKSYYTTKIA